MMDMIIRFVEKSEMMVPIDLTPVVGASKGKYSRQGADGSGQPFDKLRAFSGQGAGGRRQRVAKH